MGRQLPISYICLLFSGFSNVYHFVCVWPTALKPRCITNFDSLYLVMGFISLANEIQFTLISSHHICIPERLFASFGWCCWNLLWTFMTNWTAFVSRSNERDIYIMFIYMHKYVSKGSILVVNPGIINRCSGRIWLIYDLWFLILSIIIVIVSSLERFFVVITVCQWIFIDLLWLWFIYSLTASKINSRSYFSVAVIKLWHLVNL